MMKTIEPNQNYDRSSKILKLRTIKLVSQETDGTENCQKCFDIHVNYTLLQFHMPTRFD